MTDQSAPQLRVCFLWHQHQPYYRTGPNAVLPWVWLHATKDYLEMAQHIERVPNMRATFNLVPSLLNQLKDYLDGAVIDPVLVCMEKPSSKLTEEERLFMLEHFFYAHIDHVMRRSKRYSELYDRAQIHQQKEAATSGAFTEQDFRDLAVHYALAWTGEFSRRNDPARSLIEKDRDYTEEEKTALVAQHRMIVAQVIPLHEKLCKSGQIEVTASPFYHPILPLLIDTNSARQSMPSVPLPRLPFQHREEAQIQIEEGRKYSESIFGIAPRGMWPSEGSVSEAAIALAADAGYEWVATDQAILDRAIANDPRHVDRPDLAKYFPWKFDVDSKTISMFFRDHALSDLIGFDYQNKSVTEATNDFLWQLLDIREKIIAAHGEEAVRHAVVSIILDGENCWEYYPKNGYEFISRLYERLTTTPELLPSTMSAALDAVGVDESRTLEHFTPGSWIEGTFNIWIGHPEENTAWEALERAKRSLDSYMRRVGPARIATDPSLNECLAKAHEELRISEGSDWFWWYGDDHPTYHKAEFDELFRAHLRAVYSLLDERVPEYLLVPIPDQSTALAHRINGASGNGMITPTLDGMSAVTGWENAITIQSEQRGAMTRSSGSQVDDIRVGWNETEIFIRVVPALRNLYGIHFEFANPVGLNIQLRPGRFGMSRSVEQAPIVVGGRGSMKASAEAAFFRSMLETNGTLKFAVHLQIEKTKSVRVPIVDWLECRIG
jgi:alpha-amylase/alpha-mannosidase (GH57 family)